MTTNLRGTRVAKGFPNKGEYLYAAQIVSAISTQAQNPLFERPSVRRSQYVFRAKSDWRDSAGLSNLCSRTDAAQAREPERERAFPVVDSSVACPQSGEVSGGVPRHRSEETTVATRCTGRRLSSLSRKRSRVLGLSPSRREEKQTRSHWRVSEVRDSEAARRSCQVRRAVCQLSPETASGRTATA